MNAPRAIPTQPKRGALPADWSAHHDNRLRDAKGRYGKIAKLSDEWGIATGVLVARWHLLRAGRADLRVAPPAPGDVPPLPAVVEPLTFKNMRMKVTPRMREILFRIGPEEQGNSLELARDLGVASVYILKAVERNRDRMARAGWSVRLQWLHKAGTQLTVEKLS